MSILDLKNLRVALVHDYLRWHGGAERVLESLHEIWPEAPVYTSVYTPDSMPAEYKSWNIKTSFMQSLPFMARFLKHYSFLYPLAFEQFDFKDYDVVISSSAGFAKGIITKPNTLHISYIHTPPRFQWGYETQTRQKLSGFYTKIILPPIDNYLRIWDQCAAERVDIMIANSLEVSKRIRKFYRRDSIVINPPVDIDRFHRNTETKDGYFVTVSRLERYKKIDLLVNAFNKTGQRLKIIGNGSDEQYIRSIAGANVEVLTGIEDRELEKIMVGADGFVFAGEEDFGIVMVEALAAGLPVIAYKKGGAEEIVEENINGIFFDINIVGDLEDKLEKFNPKNFDPDVCRKSAVKYSKHAFQKKIKTLIISEYQKLHVNGSGSVFKC